MIRILFNFLTTLLLLTSAACSTHGPDPTPTATLEGNWKVSSTGTTEYKSDGSVQSQSGSVPSTTTTTYVFTAATLTTAVAGTMQYQYTYTQANNVLTLTPVSSSLPGPFMQTIAQLTSAAFVLQDKRSSVSGGTTVTTLYLAR
jgi:hypothetical protein